MFKLNILWHNYFPHTLNSIKALKNSSNILTRSNTCVLMMATLHAFMHVYIYIERVKTTNYAYIGRIGVPINVATT